MKPNWYALAAFAAVCAAIVGAHFAKLDDVVKLLVPLVGALVTALFPQVLQKKDGDR